jgi:hypothetical protein
MPSWGDFEAARRRAAALGVQAAIGPRYFVGVDLGQSRDPTAIAVVRRVVPLLLTLPLEAAWRVGGLGASASLRRCGRIGELDKPDTFRAISP